MSNRALWNVRLRHESLVKPAKGKRMKRRTRVRNGMQETLEREQTDADSEARDAAQSPS